MSRSKWLRLVVSVCILSWLAYRINWAELVTTVQSIHWEWWFASVALGVCVSGLNGLRWRLLGSPLGLTDSWRRYAALCFVGTYVNLFLPSTAGGDFARAWYLDDGRGKRAPAIISVLVEQQSNMLVSMTLGLVAAIVYSSTLADWLVGLVIALVVAYWLMIVLFVAFAGRIGSWLGRRRWRWAHVAHHYADTWAQAVVIYRAHLGAFFRSQLLAVAIQCLVVVSVWMIGKSLGLTVSLAYWAMVWPLLVTLLWLPISLSGFGVREGTLAFLLAPLAVPESAAVTVGLVIFLNTLIVGGIGGLIYTLGMFPHVPDDAAAEVLAPGALPAETGQPAAANAPSP